MASSVSNDRTVTAHGRGAQDEQTTTAVTVLFSPDARAIGRVAPLTGDPLFVGRQPGSDGLAVDDPFSSRRHAGISWDADRGCYVLRDLDSRNGTYVNGRRIPAERLSPGDIVRVGDAVLLLSELIWSNVGWSAPAKSPLKGRSAKLRALLDDVGAAAPTDLSVLIQGETGTGKELIARELHRLSEKHGPFVPLNCAAIPESLLESELFGHVKGAFSGADRDHRGLLREADRGTLFLDEVSEMPLRLQAKLLRVLDDLSVRPVGALRSVEVSVRVVSATNQDLEAAVEVGRFRGDLFARLNQWQVQAPPLRDRPEDLLPIVQPLLESAVGGRQPPAMTGGFFEALALHDWPYNVRELISVVRAAKARANGAPTLRPEHLPPELRQRTEEPPAGPPPTLPPPGTAPTPAELLALAEHLQGNVAEMARHVGTSRTQIYRMLRAAGIDAERYRGRGARPPE